MNVCPRCGKEAITKAGMVKDKQRYKCKPCAFHFTVAKEGKSIESNIVKRALQLYLEGLSYRDIERFLGVSHVSVMNWVKKYNVSRPRTTKADNGYDVFSKEELLERLESPDFIENNNLLISRLNKQYMVVSFPIRD